MSLESGTTTTDWRAVADALAAELRNTMLRNAALDAAGWVRAEAALRQYEAAAGVLSRTASPPAR